MQPLGIIIILLGVKLISARKHANTLIINGVDNDTEILNLISALTSYLKIQGILIIVGLIIFGIASYFGLIETALETNYYF
mgnify:CR=1 FL=1